HDDVQRSADHDDVEHHVEHDVEHHVEHDVEHDREHHVDHDDDELEHDVEHHVEHDVEHHVEHDQHHLPGALAQVHDGSRHVVLRRVGSLYPSDCAVLGPDRLRHCLHGEDLRPR